MRRQKRKNGLPAISHEFTVFVLSLFLFSVGLWLTLVLWNSFRQPLPESGAFVLKHVPADVAKELQVATASATYKIPVLLYHYVENVKEQNDTIRKSLAITPALFESQIQTLTAAGFTFLQARDIPPILLKQKRLPTKPVVLTFDDGYRDFYTDAFPILTKYQIKATIYVVTGFLDTPNYLLGSQLSEIVRSGFIEIGAHTVHHTNLSGKSQQEIKFEVIKSKDMLEQMLATPVVSFAYPYGQFDRETIEVVKKAGFTNAVSTILGSEASTNNQYFLYRIRTGNRTGSELLYYLEHVSSEQQSFESR